MRYFRGNEDAVEGIPFKMIIIVFILAIGFPMIWSGLANYDRSQKENDLKSELEFVITTIKLVYTSGVGNSQQIDVDFTSSFATKVEKVWIGGGTKDLWSTIRYKLSGSSKRTVVIQNPNIPVADNAPGGLDEFVLGEGRHTLRFTANATHNLDDDSRKDLYVEVDLVR
jgi:hypothetical protein